jgi:NAD(P)-dependent dehydrogenase (short-subunit alcohol dehydrogenase family)
MSKPGAFVVTGSGSGIGQAIARQLTQAGHYVYGLGRDRAKLLRTAGELQSGHFVFSAADLSEPKATHAAVLEIRDWLSEKRLPLMGLVNNAGVFDHIAFHLTSDAIWERQFHNNLLSAVRLTRELYPVLHKSSPSETNAAKTTSHSSCVLNISSTLGIRPVSHTSAYSALKAAMVNWSKTLALEWAPENIRVNCICPGLVDTPIHGFHSHSETDESRLAAHRMQPLGRMGTPDDIAEASLYLLFARWTTGTVLSVDGGISL